jgi:uncharacterized protein (DUF1778 family)
MPTTTARSRKRKTTDACSTTTIRIPTDARARLQAAADVERRSLSNFLIVSALARADELLGREKK